MVVTELLVKNFPYIFETGYTAQLEGELDAVEDGTEKWTDLLNGFYGHFEKELKVAENNMEDVKRTEEATHGDLRQVRESADSEVGQVRQLLFVQQLHEGEADDGGGGTVEEGSEGGD